MMKISRGQWGAFGIGFLGIIFLSVIFPISIFPQQKTQLVDTLIIGKNRLLADTTRQDSTRQLKRISKQDTVLDILPRVKPDYSNFTMVIDINDGQQYSKSREVNLNLVAPRAQEMILGNKKDLSNAQWEPFQSYKRWILAGQDGNRSVYFRVRYPDSTLSRVVQDEIILSSTPPVAKFQVMPDSGIAGETLFSFDATESSHQFDVFLRWDWDGDGQFDTEWSKAKQVVNQYRFGGGRKQVRLEIKDHSGWLVSATKDIIVHSRPYPDFTYTPDFENPLKITFDATNSGDYEDGNNLQFRWDLNADSLWESDWSTDKKITHTLEPFDEILVTVEAKDSQGITNIFASKVVNCFYDMVYVPAGDFSMGHDEFEIDERPTHEVYLDAFWIDKYPVTNAKFADFLNDYVQKYPGQESDISRFIDLTGEVSPIQCEAGKYVVNHGYENHPVVNVTWIGANAYCSFYDKRLPTEAEWEKAARGTDGRSYAWGDTVDSSRANYWDSGDPFEDSTTPVGFFNGRNYKGFQTNNSQSFFGAYDMGGNIKEWASDWYLRNYYSQSPKANPQGPQTGEKKVVRGGGFLFHSDQLRVTFRYAMPPERSTNFIGFRCVKSK